MTNGISTSIRSIIDSFLSGFDVLGRLQDKQRQKKLRSVRAQDDHYTTKLKYSLRRGPREIEDEYQRGVYGLGEQFGRGDDRARRSLTDVLLKLNTGLVNIIASLLENDKHAHRSVDYQSLIYLSEASRRDSLDTLRQLYQRITVSSRIPARLDDPPRKRDASKQSSRPVRVKRQMIARVSIEDSSKRSQLALVKPGVKKSLPPPAAYSSSSNLSIARSKASSTTAVNSIVPRKASPSDLISTLSAPPMSRGTGRLAAKSTPKLLPSHSPEHSLLQSDRKHDTSAVSSPVPLPRRKTAPTILSIATDSTKLGEIPIHRRAVPYDFDAESTLNRQAMQAGWPLRDIDGNVVSRPKKRGFFGVFRRKEEAV